MTSRAETMLADLRRAGLKLTPQRIAIVNELADDLTHPTAQMLFERLRTSFPTMSFATVYSTLDTLTRCGLADALSFGGAVRFDPNTQPHHHAVCDVCGAIHDLPIERIQRVDVDVDEKRGIGVIGFKVLREQRTYRGLCDRCTTS